MIKEIIAAILLIAAIIGAYVFVDVSQRKSAERYEAIYGE